MKRFLAFILMFTLSFLLVGCMPSGESTKNPDQQEKVDDIENASQNSEILPLIDVTYPEMTPYPDESNVTDWIEHEKQYSLWQADRRAQREFQGRGEGVDGYVSESIKKILQSDTNDNVVYSPLNVYMALGMLAELTDGNSRVQILELLGEDSIEDLRKSAIAVWNNNYCSDGALTSVMASSVWVDEGIALIEKTADALAKCYYSEIYSCDVGSSEMIETYKAWLNEQTGGLLKDAVENTQIDPDTILALATTVYFRAKWQAEFSEDFNTIDVFNTADGAVECEFMHQSASGSYYYSENFAAVQRGFNDGGAMWLILPDEGVTLNQLACDEAALDLIMNNGGSCESSYVIINSSIPKFDVNSDIDLKQKLIDLGITDVFNREAADFSNLSAESDGNVWLDKVKHVARVAIDEEGVTAAAYTEMLLCGAAAPPQEQVDFVLDRPFMFVITGMTGDVLFVGTVNNPIA